MFINNLRCNNLPIYALNYTQQLERSEGRTHSVLPLSVLGSASIKRSHPSEYEGASDDVYDSCTLDASRLWYNCSDFHKTITKVLRQEVNEVQDILSPVAKGGQGFGAIQQGSGV
jgi:hypothetical protein